MERLSLWASSTIVGPFVLLAVIIWVVLRSRRRAGEPPEVTERATKQLTRKRNAPRRRHGRRP